MDLKTVELTATGLTPAENWALKAARRRFYRELGKYYAGVDNTVCDSLRLLNHIIRWINAEHKEC